MGLSGVHRSRKNLLWDQIQFAHSILLDGISWSIIMWLELNRYAALSSADVACKELVINCVFFYAFFFFKRGNSEWAFFGTFENMEKHKNWVQSLLWRGWKNTTFQFPFRAVLSVRKQLTYPLPEGCFGPGKRNNIGTFAQIFYEFRGNSTYIIQDRTALFPLHHF